MPINWEEAFNRLFEIINTKFGDDEAPYYYKGSKFLATLKEFDYAIPRNYTAYLQQRTEEGKSTSRQTYYKELLHLLSEDKRRAVYLKFIAELEAYNLAELLGLKAMFGIAGSGDEAIKIAKLPDPKMSQETYTDIIATINKIMKGFEQKKPLYATMNEETIRDYLIGALETRYDSTTTTREALNKSGKTDILIKHADQTNLIVAECKFWSGAQGFTATINQLFNLYLTWRDSKAAVIIFVRNTDFSAVLATIKTEIQKHPHFVRHIKDTDLSSFSYIFHFLVTRKKKCN